MVRYFVYTWIGCAQVIGIEPIPFDEGDAWIRQWIINSGLDQRNALFPQLMWNMCERYIIFKGGSEHSKVSENFLKILKTGTEKTSEIGIPTHLC